MKSRNSFKSEVVFAVRQLQRHKTILLRCRSLLVVFVVSLPVLCSCGSGTTVSFYVQRPPEVNSSLYTRIIVDPIENSASRSKDGSHLRSTIISKLVASRIFKAVSDNMSDVSGTSNEGPALVLGGMVTVNNYEESYEHSQQLFERTISRPGKKDTITRDSIVHYYATKGTLRLSAIIRLRDFTQNSIIWSTPIDVEKSVTNSNLNDKPAPIYSQGLERDAISEVADRVVQSFYARQERTTLRLFEDDDLPELEAGNTFAKKQLWQDAANSYHKSILAHSKSAALHKALYDFACANMVIGNYETAERNFRKAIELKKDEEIYTKTLALCLRMKEESTLMKQYVR